MSGRADLRMYVEHLFEGRTLDAETIELKEEIYGNLVARFDDYVTQGISEDEAYRRTCEAVTSVDDVLDEKDADAAGERDEQAVGKKLDAEKTRAAGAPVPPGAEAASVGAADKPRHRWSVGKVVGVVALCILGVIVVSAIATQALFAGVNREAATTQDSVEVLTEDDRGTGSSSDGSGDLDTTTNSTTDNTTGTKETTMSDTGLLDTTRLYAIVTNHDQTALASHANAAWPPDGSTLAAVLEGLPLAEWLVSTSAEEQTVLGNTVVAEYEVTVNDHVYDVDDDLLERTLAYNAMAVLALVPDAETVQVRLVENDAEDGDVDLDVYDFRRADVEAILGSSLTAESLDATTWDSLRTLVLSERVGDRIVECGDA